MNDKADDAERVGPQLSDELKRFAADLAGLRPREDRLDRERLAFLAGQASVAGGSPRPLNVLGLPLESRAWPAAFAAMSAVAAALLFALLVRPEAPGLHEVETNDRVDGTLEQMSIDHSKFDGVLTTRDAHLGDIQSRLAMRDFDQTDSPTSPSFPHDRDAPILTPNAWHHVINWTEKPKPSSGDSSSLFQNRGVTL